jgi:hypothetical protein
MRRRSFLLLLASGLLVRRVSAAHNESGTGDEPRNVRVGTRRIRLKRFDPSVLRAGHDLAG